MTLWRKDGSDLVWVSKHGRTLVGAMYVTPLLSGLFFAWLYGNPIPLFWGLGLFGLYLLPMIVLMSLFDYFCWKAAKEKQNMVGMGI